MNRVRESDLRAYREQQMRTIEELGKIMFELDKDSDEELSASEFEKGNGNTRLLELLKLVDFPSAFTFKDIHQMLNQDGSDHISRREFFVGMMRLIYNSDFQQDCLLQLSTSQIKNLVFKMQQELEEDIRQAHALFLKDIMALRQQISPTSKACATAPRAVDVAFGLQDANFRGASQQPPVPQWDSTPVPQWESISVSQVALQLEAGAAIPKKSPNKVASQPSAVEATSPQNPQEPEESCKVNRAEASSKEIVAQKSAVLSLGSSTWAVTLINNFIFRNLVNAVILINTVQMGLAADYKSSEMNPVWEVFDHIFTAIFVVEMITKLFALKLSYFYDRWNDFDFVIAWVSVFDTWIIPLVADSSNVSIIKVFRLLRLVRIAKLLKIFPDLMVVMEGVVASIRALTWICLLLVVILYTLAICCVQMIGKADAGYGGFDTDNLMEEADVAGFNNYLYFGSVGRSMLSLFSISLVAEWPEVARPVGEIQPILVFLMIFFVLLTALGILNIIIGIIVEKTSEAMNAVRESHAEAHRKKTDVNA
eukprot:gnl/TRDRNA2_/TRDRNA2_171975_c0_seq1.p1 gnl/TRDRNA2_/TRDRNA2_171975_c0~~gnl/TRDRNA2_/TRDRNA2_171975_c0_seq1.p1  ORF type:complete len:602 (-),score=96.97 gnl/TRDRNA2_/TRDRNA2_171975_c0_seq1:532-2145(-)